MDSYITTFYAVLLLIASVGSLVVAKWYERDKQRRAEAEEFWRQMQPNLYNGGLKGHLYKEEDELHQAPVLPDNYKDWSK